MEVLQITIDRMEALLQRLERLLGEKQ